MTTTPPAPAPAPDAVPQPPATPPVEAPRKRSWFARHKILTGIGGLVLFVMLVNALNGGSDEPAAQPPAAGGSDGGGEQSAPPAQDQEEAEEPAEEPLPGIGATVADGDFEFVVTGIETGVTEIGTDFLGTTAQGQFVLVQLTVTNIGNEASNFWASDQALLDTLGREHASDTSAPMYLEDSTGWIDAINPGNTLQGTLVFDIPTDAVPASIRLHDSSFSNGIEVALQ